MKTHSEGMVYKNKYFERIGHFGCLWMTTTTRELVEHSGRRKKGEKKGLCTEEDTSPITVSRFTSRNKIQLLMRTVDEELAQQHVAKQLY
ncbi:hypothetical protein JTE90_016174 [Oedothorax gibbosus]|uniref:Uncharacterized protein n=1 Tax=Oedothorax gibbosus TaxID=931172 RepID=A0AAV6UTL8_9ARAC|nr:hypothetical protein JTE90_016174 [Oedothorax gibbosus]